MNARSAASLAVIFAATLAGCRGETQAPVIPLATAFRTATWPTPYANGVEQTTERYRIYSTVSGGPLRSHLPGFMEASYQNYIDLTGLADRPPSGKMIVYMLGTRREWAHLTQQTVKDNAEVYLNIEAGGYCYQGVCVFWDIGALATFSVAAHEGLHQFFAHRMRQPLPSWLEEGLCVTAEGYDMQADTVRFTPDRNVLRFTHLRQAIVNGRWVPLESLLTMDAGDAISRSTEAAAGYYGQLWALIVYIRSQPQYRQGLSRLLTDAEAGRLHETLRVEPGLFAALRMDGRAYNRHLSLAILRQYFTEDLPGFEKGYRAHANRLAGLSER